MRSVNRTAMLLLLAERGSLGSSSTSSAAMIMMMIFGSLLSFYDLLFFFLSRWKMDKLLPFAHWTVFVWTVFFPLFLNLFCGRLLSTASNLPFRAGCRSTFIFEYLLSAFCSEIQECSDSASAHILTYIAQWEYVYVVVSDAHKKRPFPAFYPLVVIGKSQFIIGHSLRLCTAQQQRRR